MGMTRFKRWTPVLSLLVLALVALVLPATAAAAVESTVTITSGEGSEFTGKVFSPKQRCRAARTVKLFREDDSGDEDSLAGTAKTGKTGAWMMDGSFVVGVYFARVLPAIFHVNGMAIRCAGDISIRQHF
jgi:hypothetical protein